MVILDVVGRYYGLPLELIALRVFYGFRSAVRSKPSRTH